MLRGNDPVAYFTLGRPVKGDPDIEAERGGVTYRFASAEHRADFLKSPARHEPASVGFCASGAPYALKAKIGADAFTIYRGRLHLFGSERSKRGRLLDAEHNVALGDKSWEDETKNVPHRLQNYKRHLFKVPHYKTDAGLDAEYERRKAAGPLPAEPR